MTFDDDAHLNEARMVLFKEQVGLSYSVSGNTLIARVSENELRQIASGAVEQNLTTLRNRINELGVAEPIIQRQGMIVLLLSCLVFRILLRLNV